MNCFFNIFVFCCAISVPSALCLSCGIGQYNTSSAPYSGMTCSDCGCTSQMGVASGTLSRYNYSDYPHSCEYRLQGSSSDTVMTLNFNRMYIENGAEFIRIYRCGSATDKTILCGNIDEYTGFYAAFQFTTKNQFILIIFTSWASTAYSGWGLTWSIQDSAAAAEICENCPDGLSSPAGSIDSAACIELVCGVGLFVDKNTCTACSKGKYKSITGNSICTECESGKYNSYTGSGVCASCPYGSNSLAGSIDYSSCKCNSELGFYGPNASTCLQCGIGKYLTFLSRNAPIASSDGMSCSGCGCTSQLGVGTGTLSRYSYSNSEGCVYRFYGSSSETIMTLTFIYLQTEPWNCLELYRCVDINCNDKERIVRNCGNPSIPDPFSTRGQFFMLTFITTQTDSTVTSNGWGLTWNIHNGVLPASEGCQNCSDGLTSPVGSRKYTACINLTCEIGQYKTFPSPNSVPIVSSDGMSCSDCGCTSQMGVGSGTLSRYNYTNSESCVYLLYGSSSETTMTLSFNQLNVESGYDFLRIYRCTGGGPTGCELNFVLAAYTGVYATFEYTTQNQFLMIIFTSNNFRTKSGWGLTWNINNGVVNVGARCQNCPVGLTSPVDSTYSTACTRSCVSCLTGKYSAHVAATSNGTCVDCVAGKYSAHVAATSYATCVDCGAGKYAPTTASNLCSNCSPGTYSASSASVCTTCAPNSLWSADHLTCRCNSGSSGPNGRPPCTLCIPGKSKTW